MAEDGERSNESEPEQESAPSGDEPGPAEDGPEPEPERAKAEPESEPDEPASAAAPSEGSADAPKADDASPAGAKKADDASSAGAKKAEPAAGSAASPPARRRASMLWWALPVLMIVEFYFYGHNGRLEICVGKEGDTDFSLVGQERTDENRWKFPRCETRLNLGLRSQKEAKVEEGIKVACRGATIFRHQGEAKACVAGEQGWVHQVEGHFVPPWEPAYYQHLFWFLQ